MMNVGFDPSLQFFRSATGVSRVDTGELPVFADPTDLVPAERPALTVTRPEPTGVDMMEEDFEADLRRDDAIGRLVVSAFDLKPPEMPEFV